MRGDAELVAACRAGDEDARRELAERLGPRVHAVALHFFGAGGAATAADVTQEVLVKALTKLHQWRGESSLTTWVHRMTVNACLDERRARRPFVALEAAQAHADRAPGPAETQEAAQRQDLVRLAVARLPEKLRIAVLLRHFGELSYDEMAVALGCSPGTVASRLSRGHAQLAQELRALRDETP